MDKYSKREVKRIRKARNFPINTCPASRHTQMMGEAMVRGKPYPMMEEEREYCGGSILSTVASLFEARTERDQLRAALERILDDKEVGLWGYKRIAEDALAASDHALGKDAAPVLPQRHAAQ